jgi:predicted chitinase
MRYLYTQNEYHHLNEAEDTGAVSMIKKAFGLGEPATTGELGIPENLSTDKKKNVEAIIEAMKRNGITNPMTQKAILGVIGKESGFVPQSEISYSKTDNSRIRKIFGKRVAGLNDAQLTELKKDDVKFFDKVYGKEAKEYLGFDTGNTEPGDGFKYRGRGFNGITFKSTYKKFQDILSKYSKMENVPDIMGEPESLNSDPNVAAEVAVLFFIDAAKSPKMKQKYGTNDINSFTDQKTALKAITNLNAGIGKDIESDYLKSFELASKAAEEFDIKGTEKA